MIIYKATNKKNGKSYIGQTKYSLEFRKNAHKCDSKRSNHSTIVFYKAINKYSIDLFKWEILCECQTKNELNEMEFHYIKQYNTLAPNGYNLTLGGEGHYGAIFSKETKEKMKKSKLGPKNSMYGKKGKNNPNYGRKNTLETIKKMSECKIGNKNPNFGKNFSDEYRENLRKGQNIRYQNNRGPMYGKKGKNNPNYGRKNTLETIKKMSECKIGNKNPNYGKGKYKYIIVNNNNNNEFSIDSFLIWCRENKINKDKLWYASSKGKFFKGYFVKRLNKEELKLNEN